MLDQTFSSQNFNYIFLKENRKGTFDKDYLAKEYLDKHEEFKQLINEKNSLRQRNNGLTQEELDQYKEQFDKVNKEKELIRTENFHLVSNEIHEKDFNFNIIHKPGDEIYIAQKSLAVFFAMKQLQHNISKTFKVLQSNRNYIVKQLYGLVGDGYPKVIIRTDIESFYESIPQDKLLQKIEGNNLLSSLSKKLIKKIFYEFESVKDTTIINPGKGIPRGVAISPLLAELYLKDLDREIQSIPDLIYYARYVDDIVAIFCPKTASTKRVYIKEIEERVTNSGLSLSTPKTEIIDVLDKGVFNKSFTYLGYKFELLQTANDFKTFIEISDAKLDRYNQRLKLAVENYNVSSKYNEPIARSMLIARIKFLTGNYHLNNTKRNIKTGLFYSNAMLLLNKGNFKSLKALDRLLMQNLQLLCPPVKIGIDKQNMVKFLNVRFSFSKSYNLRERAFYSFRLSSREVKYYRKKYGRIVSAFEVIKSVW